MKHRATESRRVHPGSARTPLVIQFILICLTAVLWSSTFPATKAWAQGARFVVDDDKFQELVTSASLKLLHGSKLMPLRAIQSQVQMKGYAFKPVRLSQEKLSPPDLCERLRQSTLAVGTIYKCPDCGDWHFDSSAGFVVGEDGIVSTCCHVVLGEDCGTKEAYVVAADSTGHVFPVRSVLAADVESDTCLLKLEASGLRPLPLRAGARAGERIYCLSHPGGYHYMFTEGLIARINLKRNESLDNDPHTKPQLTRPILFLNITAEFAPGSSGAPVVDEAGNVVGQVASIADAGEPESGDDHHTPSPSVPIRFCTAAEEILHLAELNPAKKTVPQLPPKRKQHHPSPPTGSGKTQAN